MACKQGCDAPLPQELDFSPHQTQEQSRSQSCLLAGNGPPASSDPEAPALVEAAIFLRSCLSGSHILGEREMERDLCQGPFPGTEMNSK